MSAPSSSRMLVVMWVAMNSRTSGGRALWSRSALFRSVMMVYPEITWYWRLIQEKLNWVWSELRCQLLEK